MKANSKKILIIPHHPGLSKIKIRLIEIARALSKKHTVYLVNWHAPTKRYSMTRRVLLTLRDIFARIRFYREGSLIIVEFPILHGLFNFASRFNYFWLRKIIEREKIDVVINGSLHMFDIPSERSFNYVFDLADLPVLGDGSYSDTFVANRLTRELKKADAVTVVSRGLVDYVLENYRLKAFFIPNGAEIEKIRSVKEEEVYKIRQRYNLIDRFVIGYIGNIGSWVDVEFAVKAFRQVLEHIPHAVLLWIGPSPGLEKLKKKYAAGNIIFTGGVDGSIEPYFRVLDIGILPHIKCLYQDVAFHLKLIEYTAARKIAISSPLEEVERLRFPNILTVGLDPQEWSRCIIKIRDMKWKDEWDDLVADFDWEKIGLKFIEIIEKITEPDKE